MGQVARRGGKATVRLADAPAARRTISKCVCLWHIGVAVRTACPGVGSPRSVWSGTMSDREIDRQLVARAQRGDKRAFELLVEKYQRKLRSEEHTSELQSPC